MTLKNTEMTFTILCVRMNLKNISVETILFSMLIVFPLLCGTAWRLPAKMPPPTFLHKVGRHTPVSVALCSSFLSPSRMVITNKDPRASPTFSLFHQIVVSCLFCILRSTTCLGHASPCHDGSPIVK